MSEKRWSENRAVYLGARLHTHYRAGQPWYVTGTVSTHFGIVEIYAQGFQEKMSSNRYSIFRFIHRGREYSLHVPQLLTSRGLATVARRFASEVEDGQHD